MLRYRYRLVFDGHGDQTRFVPMTVAPATFIYFSMFSLDRRLAGDQPARVSERAVLVVLSLGYLAFALLLLELPRKVAWPLLGR